MSKDDLINDNVDLIKEAASLLAALPVRSLRVEVQASSPMPADVAVTTQGILRLDVYLDGRPLHSLDVQGGQTTSVSKRGTDQAVLEIQGFEGS